MRRTIALLALTTTLATAAHAVTYPRDKWRWGPRLAPGLSLKTSSSEPNIAGSAFHVGLDMQLLHYWRSWVVDLSAGGFYNLFKGSDAAESVTVDTLAFSLELGGRYRFGGWQAGPALRLLVGEDVSLAEDNRPTANYTKSKAALFAGLNLERELTFTDLDWRIGAHFYTDLTISPRQVYWVGLQMALELPFEPRPTPPPAAIPAQTSKPVAASHSNKKMPVMQTRGSTVYLSFDDTILEFETDMSRLRPEARKILTSVSSFLLSGADRWRDVRIEGHADYRGSPTHNQSLSFDRAKSVAIELQNMGIDPGRIATKGFGSSRPVYHGSDVNQLVRNRRVEVYVEVLSEAEQFLQEFRTHLENRP